MSGFHRTYIGQIERGEKNISFGNLSKISSVLGVTLAELLSGLESLTASELRVAELAAEGRSNPAIAQELFVSRKTVEAHLHRAYAKLDIRGRDELPLVLRPAPTNTVSADRPPRD